MRVLWVIAAATPLLVAQDASKIDAREIVRRSVDLERKNADNWINYTYLDRELQRQFDGSGKVKSETLRTFDVTNLEGSPYRRLVARNDQPLSPDEQKNEENKLQWNNEERRKETPEQRQRRLAEWKRRQERQREAVYELPDAFDFHVAGEEKIDGHDVWVIDGAPRQGFKPRSAASAVLTKMKARFWITKPECHWVKLDAETLDSFTYGVLLLRIGKGAHITIEQSRVAGDVWLPKRIALNGSARILLVKSIRAQIDHTYSNYKRFQVDSRVVSTGEK